MLKKKISVVMAAVMCLTCLAGCNSDTAATDSTTAADAQLPAGEVTGELSGGVDGWTYGQVAMGGGGFVTGVFSTCEENVYYARTDVGGAYRWNEQDKQWKSLNYWVSPEDVGLLGISAIAVDPENAAKVYMLAGTEYFSGGKTCILISENYGESFDVVELTDMIKVHGNGMGRGNGERLAIDPNNKETILAGGCSSGIIRSTDGGRTWTQTDFPVKGTTNGNGVNIIVFDPNTEGLVYAAASQTSENLFVSKDSGATWTALGWNPDLMPQRIKLDSKGNLYVVCGDKEGPWNQSKGAVYKYDPASGTAENIAPTENPFGDIVIDPTDENKMVLVTTQTWVQQPNGSWGDTFFTTTDGGANWTDIISKMTMSTNDIPWIEDCAMHWCCSLSMNPFDTDKIMVTSGNGIFACDNIFDEAPAFYFNSNGIEETVPMDIITLPDYPLVTAVMDYDGFVHEDIFKHPQRHQDKIGSTTSITIAAQNRDYWAKVGGNDSTQMLSISTDGGKTWSAARRKPEKGKNYYQGCVAFNADGSRLIWLPSNSSFAFYTEDLGASWTKCEGLMGKDIYIIGDSVNPDYVYAYGKDKLYVSSDGGKNFTKKGTDLFLFEDRICIAPEEGCFYLPTGGGLYKTTDHGETFTQYETVAQCSSVGIGKAKNEGDPYVIYIYGNTKENQTIGIHMSEDDGATWTLITDEAHQFGGMGNGDMINGDLNVYGRCYMTTVGLGVVYCDKTEK